MKFLTDMHTHTSFSPDAENRAEDMLAMAQKKGLAFYGISDHFEFDCDILRMPKEEVLGYLSLNEEEYFHALRHLQEDYEGVMNVAVGAEIGYTEDAKIRGRYELICEKYHPDFVINSVHGVAGMDFAFQTFEEDKRTVYGAYLALVRKSLDVSYPYDVVGHLGYIARYVPFEDKSFAGFENDIDDILTAIIQKGKILEVNTAVKGLKQATLPNEDILKRYFALGGRMVSLGSDAHNTQRIAEGRERAVQVLKEIGFTHVTVPFKGEYIKAEL
ncbi:MAG: histidinol-phosphatase HisJ family protein [Clostridia bacterium]|nr:histidinol-phosphatase HisJ family protein [Clostridia bacterium]